MSFRAHLLDHKPAAVVDTLKYRYYAVDFNEQAPTALQVAAREGMLEATLWLLNAGAPVDQAAEETKREEKTLKLAEQDSQKNPSLFSN